MEFLFMLFLGLIIGLPVADTVSTQRNADFLEFIITVFMFTFVGIVIWHIIGYGHIGIFGPITVPSGFGQ